MAGITRLITQIQAVVIPMPAWLVENEPSRYKLIPPLKPNSAIVKLGIMASTKNITLITANVFHQFISTSNKRKSRKYCIMKIIYLAAERDSNLKANVAFNSLKLLIR